jgi:hypothetical protein
MEFHSDTQEVRLIGASNIAAETVTSVQVQVEDIACGRLVYVPAENLEEGLEVLATCDEVVNGHIRVSVSNPQRLAVEVDFGRLSTEVLEEDDWNEYQLDWDSQERLCYMVGAEEDDPEEVGLPPEMQAMVDRMEAHLPPSAEIELKKMLQEHCDVFALEGNH